MLQPPEATPDSKRHHVSPQSPVSSPTFNHPPPHPRPSLTSLELCNALKQKPGFAANIEPDLTLRELQLSFQLNSPFFVDLRPHIARHFALRRAAASCPPSLTLPACAVYHPVDPPAAATRLLQLLSSSAGPGLIDLLACDGEQTTVPGGGRLISS